MNRKIDFIRWGLVLVFAAAGGWGLFRYLDYRASEKAREAIREKAARSSALADSIITLAAVGDIMMGSNYPSAEYCPHPNLRLLDPVAPFLQQADLTFANLEGPILNRGGKMKRCDNPAFCYAFRQPEYLVDQMKEAGIDLFSVANNHLGDFGEEGRSNTLRVLEQKGLWYAGQEQHPWDTFSVKGVRVGFTAFAPNSACLPLNDPERVKEVINQLNKYCDLLIVSFHGGAEGASYTRVDRKEEKYMGEARGNVYEFARLAIDAGADVILGHGPHVPRAIDLYKGRFITYSMGNFCTYKQFGLNGPTGIAPLFQLSLQKDGRFVDGKLISVKQVGAGGPVIDETRSAQTLIESLTRSDLPELRLHIDSTGRFHF